MDSFSDNLGTGLHAIMQKYSVPAFVKSASSTDIKPDFSEEELARVCADPTNLRYPCHTKAATWISAAYLADEYDKIKPYYRKYVGDRIMKFAEYFGIKDDVEQIVNSKVNTVKQASAVPEYPDDYYMLITEKNGQIKKAGLLNNEQAVQRGADWLIKNRDRLPLHMCTEAAVQLYKRAGALGMEPPHKEQLQRMLGYGFNDPNTIAGALEKRARAKNLPEPKLAKTLLKMAQEIRNNPPEVGSETLYKVACFMDEYDHRNGLIAARKRHEYSRPEDVIYKTTVSELQKFASSTIKLQNGSIYELEKMGALDRQKFTETFGTDMASECFTGNKLNKEAAVNIFPTLPRPMADQLTRVCRSCGVAPSRQEKAAAVKIPEVFYR